MGQTPSTQKVLSGKEFNAHCVQNGLKLYKALHSNMTHYKFRYQIGLNCLRDHFNPYGECEPGGLYFADQHHIFRWLNTGSHLATVTIPDDAQVCFQKDKYKADKMIISPPEHIDGLLMKKLVQDGADINVDNGLCLYENVVNGEVFRVRHLLEAGARQLKCVYPHEGEGGMYPLSRVLLFMDFDDIMTLLLDHLSDKDPRETEIDNALLFGLVYRDKWTHVSHLLSKVKFDIRACVMKWKQKTRLFTLTEKQYDQLLSLADGDNVPSTELTSFLHQ